MRTMAGRWLLAVPLLAAGLVAVPLGRAALWAWTYGREWTVPELALRCLPWYAIVAVLLFVLRRSPRYWARLALPVALLWAVVGLFPPIYEPGDGTTQQFVVSTSLIWSVLGVALTWGLVHVAARVLTRPIAEDLADSGLTIQVKSRTSRLRVEIGRDRVRLVGMAGPAEPPAALRLAIPYARLAFVQAGTLSGQAAGASWKLPNHANVQLADGPAIRLGAPGQHWLVPVENPAAVAALIRRRAELARSAGSGTAA